MQILALVLAANYPGAQWMLKGDSVAGLDWQDKNIPRPADDVLNKLVADYVPPMSQADQIKALQAQVAALLATKAA